MKRVLFTGRCVGGPLDGQDTESRYPNGFVVIDRPNKRAWIYDHDRKTGVFRVRSEDGHPELIGSERRYRVATLLRYDIRALPS
jgi:hypothetical protein